MNFDDRAGARVEASGADDGAVVAGEVGDGKSGNGGVEVDGEVGFVVKKASGGGDDGAVVAGEVGDGNSGGVEGGVEGDGVKVDPKNSMRKCHFCDYCGQNLKRHIQKHHRGQCRGEGAVLRAIFVETEKKKIRQETRSGGQPTRTRLPVRRTWM